MVFSAVERILWNSGIIQVRRDPRNSLVPLPAEGRVSYEMRPGYLEIYPVTS